MLGKIKWQKSNRHVAKAKLSPHSFKAFIISLFLLVASIQFAEPYTCPSSIPTSMNIIKETGTFENYESVILYGLVGGQISKSIYYIYHLSSLSNPNNNSAVRKVDVSGVESWASGVQFELNVKSLSVDANEQRVIFAVDGTSNYVVVVCLKTSDGQIDSQMEFQDLKDYYDNLRIWPLSDGSGYFMIASDYSSFWPMICKYTFSTLSYQCQQIPNLDFGQAYLMLPLTQFFLIGTDSSPSYSLHMHKISFLSTSTGWTNKMDCSPGGICTLASCVSLLSSDESIIYLFFSFGSPLRYLYFAALSASSGNVISNRFKSNIEIGDVNGSAINEDYIVTFATSSSSPSAPSLLIIYTLSSASFDIQSFSIAGNLIYGIMVEPFSGRFIVTGYLQKNINPDFYNGYTAKFIPQSISSVPEFSSTSNIMTPLPSNIDPIYADFSYTMANPDPVNSLNDPGVSRIIRPQLSHARRAEYEENE